MTNNKWWKNELQMNIATGYRIESQFQSEPKTYKYVCWKEFVLFSLIDHYMKCNFSKKSTDFSFFFFRSENEIMTRQVICDVWYEAK